MKSLDQYTAPILEPAFEKFGFSNNALVADWPSVIGREIGGVSHPERIKWPRQKIASQSSQPLAGTLVLRVAPGHALMIQYKVPLIIERVNAFYGYQAITAVKIKQGALPKKQQLVRRSIPEPCQADAAHLAEQLEPVADEALKASLDKLGRTVLARKYDNRKDTSV